MSEWVSYEHWQECARLERPGFVFEVVNGEGQRLYTSCTVPLELPHDWKSAPLRFRLVAVPPPRHSAPIPKPQK